MIVRSMLLPIQIQPIPAGWIISLHRLQFQSPFAGATLFTTWVVYTFNKNHYVGICCMAGPKVRTTNIKITAVHCYEIQLTSCKTRHRLHQKTRSNWADKRQADLYCTKRNEPLGTPLMSDCPIIHTVDRHSLRPRNWFSGARYNWSTALIQWYEWKA